MISKDLVKKHRIISLVMRCNKITTKISAQRNKYNNLMFYVHIPENKKQP